MSPMDKFLQAVEKKLRGPVKRRPEVLEELRGHLADRIDALIQQEYEPEEAEAQAIEEIGPAWLLAMRLSLANGWNLFPEILREIGALGMSLVILLLAASQLSFIGRVADPNFPGPTNPWAEAAVAVIAGYLISLVALAVFAFYLARLRQSRIWAIIPIYLLFINFHNFYYLAGALFVLSVAWGTIRPSPRPVWPLLVAAGALLLAGPGVILAVEAAASHSPISIKMAAYYFNEIAISTAEFGGFLGASCFLWLGAWVLERVRSSAVVKA